MGTPFAAETAALPANRKSCSPSLFSPFFPSFETASDGTRRSRLVGAVSGYSFLDAEVIDDLEHAGYAVGHHAGKVLVRFRGHDTHECHVPILHDNMNRGNGAP